MTRTQRRRYPHLPEGRQPGAQTTTRYGTLQWALRFFVLLLGLTVVGSAVAFLVVASQLESAVAVFTGFATAVMFALTGVAIVGWTVRDIKRTADRPASHLQLVVDPTDVRRGERVTATLTLTDPANVAPQEVQVGLVCTEWYDETRYTGRGHHTRATAEALAHEEWVVVDHKVEPQSFAFRIPSDAPFSYEGSCLSFGWKVSARQVRVRRTDRTTNVPIWVRP